MAMTTKSRSSEMCGPYEAVTFERKPIHAMGFHELEAIKQRCVDYRAKCTQSGKAPHEHYITLENSVDFYIDKFTHLGTMDAYGIFAELRKAAMTLGYTVPSLYGAMDVQDIVFACAALREAIAMATPLPGEPPRLTGELITEADASLSRAIGSINKKYK